MAKKLGELLLQEGLIDPEQLDRALEEQLHGGERVGAVLIKMGYISEEVLVEFLSRQFHVPAVNPLRLAIPQDISSLIPPEIAQKYQAIPFGVMGQTLNVAMADPGNLFVIDDIRFLTRKNVRVNVAPDSSIRKIIDQHYSSGESIQAFMGQMRDEFSVEVVESRDESDLASLEIAAEQAPVVKPT